MKLLLFVLCLFITAQSFAQDSAKVKMKEWIGVLTVTEKFADEKNWTANDQAIVGEHFQRLIKMKDKGIVILAGRMELQLNDPAMQGLVIFYAKDEKEANQFMQDDPAVKAKIMNAKVHPYGVAVNKCN
jgi:uncharacterized protein YciI